MNQNDFLIAKALVISALKSIGGAGYVEPGRKLRSATLTAEDGIGVAEFDNPIPLEEGKTYVVKTDSGSHTTVCKKYYEDGMNSPMLWVGDNPDIGEEISHGFYYGEVDGEAYVAMDFNGGTSFSISTPETLHPIDPKFIPWDSAPGSGTGGIPSILLTTAPTDNGGTLTDEELAFFENLSRTVTPMACVMFWQNGNLYSALCTIYSDEEGEGYAGQTAVAFPGFDYLLARLVVDLANGTVAILPLSAVSTNIG